MNMKSSRSAPNHELELLGLLRSARVIPVLTIERVEDAVPLARALVKGGVRVLEITLRTEAAIDAAKAIIAEVPEAIVGIGTVLESRRSRARRGARRALCDQSRRHAGTARRRRRRRASVHAGHRDGFGTDAGTGARVRSGQILSQRNNPAASRRFVRSAGRFRMPAFARPGASARATRPRGWPSPMSWWSAAPGFARRRISNPATGRA